eukprot:768749-Hanusia_phi.AAC.29
MNAKISRDCWRFEMSWEGERRMQARRMFHPLAWLTAPDKTLLPLATASSTAKAYPSFAALVCNGSGETKDTDNENVHLPRLHEPSGRQKRLWAAGVV